MLGTSSRRGFFKIAPGLVGGAVVATGGLGKAAELLCALTPAQTAGPFYPGESKFSWDTDLTLLPGAKERAKGQIIYLSGQVIDQNCVPVIGANVEIWQACYSGKYNNQKDPNPAPIDPNFKYWGETFSDGSGLYNFKTIIPGAYPATNEWSRPPHIHVRVSALGYREIISQMYFADHPLNAKDLILQDLTQAEQDSVLVKFSPVKDLTKEPGALEGHFTISVRKI